MGFGPWAGSHSAFKETTHLARVTEQAVTGTMMSIPGCTVDKIAERIVGDLDSSRRDDLSFHRNQRTLLPRSAVNVFHTHNRDQRPSLHDTTEDLIADLQQYAGAGGDHVVLEITGKPCDDIFRSMERLSRRQLPHASEPTPNTPPGNHSRKTGSCNLFLTPYSHDVRL